MPRRDRKLGRGFGILWTATAVSGLGDGVTQVAGPLFAVSITRNPAQVAGLMVAQQLPWMLFALPSGALVDRADRRLAMASVSVARAVALGALAGMVLLGHASMLVLAAVIAFYGLNGRRLTLTNDEAYNLVMSVAAGQLDTVDAIAAVLQPATRPRR